MPFCVKEKPFTPSSILWLIPANETQLFIRKKTKNMRKLLLLFCLSAFVTTSGFSQTDRFWSPNNANRSSIATDKAVARLSFPKEYKLFNLDVSSFRQALLSVVGARRVKPTTIITIPNADGAIEQFEVVEASNFEPDLQAQFPEIRAYTGKGITDKYATLKLSISPEGVHTMVFRSEKENEFIEPYSKDRKVYSVYKAHREKGSLPWTCTTEDKNLMDNVNAKVSAETM